MISTTFYLLTAILCCQFFMLEGRCPSLITTIAHRGNSAETPENTLAAFQSSIDLGVDYIEFDIHLSKDEVPVVIHDETTFRTGDSREGKIIKDHTVEELKSIDIGQWRGSEFKGLSIPTLAEVLDLHLGNTGLMIEIKEGSASSSVLAKKVLDVIGNFNKTKNGNPVLVGSQSPEILEHIKAELPEQPLIAIIENPKWLFRYLRHGPKIVALHSSIASEKLINNLASRNIVTWVFTVDNKNAMQKFIDIGASGIITNSPKELLALKSEYAKECKNLIDTKQLIDDPEIIRQ